MVQLFAVARLVRSYLCLICLHDLTSCHSLLAGQAAERALASVRLPGLLKRRDTLALLQVFCLSDKLARLVGGLLRRLAVEIRVKCFRSEVTQLLFLIVSMSFFEAIERLKAET